MEIRPETSPLPRLIILGLGLCAGIAAIFVAQFHNAIVHRVHCPILRATGIPCPTCGGTHAVIALLQGHLHLAAATNPLVSGGAVVFVMVVLWAFGAMFLPAWRVTLVLEPREKRAAIWLAALLIIAGWFYEIWRLI